MNQIKEYNETTFESIKHINEYGIEYWYARELMLVLEYKRWDKFNNVIDSAKVACEKSNNLIDDHFSQVGKMVEIGSGAKRKQEISELEYGELSEIFGVTDRAISKWENDSCLSDASNMKELLTMEIFIGVISSMVMLICIFTTRIKLTSFFYYYFICNRGVFCDKN